MPCPARCRCSPASAAAFDRRMPPQRFARAPAMVLALSALLVAAAPASALDVEVKGLHTAGAAVITAIELRDVIPERFRKTLVEGGVLHLRVQAELWEARPVWDRLVYPAIVRVFRLGRAPSSRDISIADSGATTSTYATMPNPMPVVVELGRNDRVRTSAKYYLHVI